MADQDIRDAAQLGVGWLRILITGSRHWRDAQMIFNAIFDYLNDGWAHKITGPHDVTIVQGGQVSEDRKTGEKWGADYLADQIALAVGFERDPLPADWRTGKLAGFRRNQTMVDKGASVCLAFPLGKSPGTRDCMRRAALAGIPVINCGDQDPR